MQLLQQQRKLHLRIRNLLTFHALIILLATLFFSCNNSVNVPVLKKSIVDTLTLRKTSNLQSFPKDTLVRIKESKGKRNPEGYLENYGGVSNKLFVFVGQKLSVEALPYRQGSMDGGYKGKYKILQKVFGSFDQDTIEFVAYDHYGRPAFSKYDNVLLFLSADSGMYYQQKYMYNDVYLTKDGKWAGAYTEDYLHDNNKKTKLKPIVINFLKEVSYPTEITSSDDEIIKLNYPAPFYNIKGNRAIAVYGNYVEELFILKRDGYLTARGIFEHGKLN